MDEKKSSWWTTLPGILTGIAGLITAIGGLLLILYEINMIGSKQNEETNDEKAKIEDSIRENGTKSNGITKDKNKGSNYLEERVDTNNQKIDSPQSGNDTLKPGGYHKFNSRDIDKLKEINKIKIDSNALRKLQKGDNLKKNP